MLADVLRKSFELWLREAIGWRASGYHPCYGPRIGPAKFSWPVQIEPKSAYFPEKNSLAWKNVDAWWPILLEGTLVGWSEGSARLEVADPECLTLRSVRWK